MAALSEEEENYIRMSLLLTGVSTRAVRSLFDSLLTPATLPSTIQAQIQKKNSKLSDLHNRRMITNTQWNTLSTNPDSKNFDITLMECLLTNLTTIRRYYLPGLPDSTDISIGADFARIKYYRNYFAHLHDSKVDSTYFRIAWTDISDVLGRIGGNVIREECHDLRTKVLDGPNIIMGRERSSGLEKTLQAQAIEIQSLKERVKSMETNMDDVIPQDLKDTPIPEVILKMDNRSIEIYKQMLETGEEKRRDIRIILVGKKGSGKTCLVKRLLRQNLTDVTKTNGIEIHVKHCEIRQKGSVWDTSDDSKDKFRSRLKRELLKFATNVPPTPNLVETVENNSSVHDPEDPVTKEDDSIAHQEIETYVQPLGKGMEETVQAILQTQNTTVEFANVYIWDFAGDEEFYNTHQMFFSQEVIYLILTSLTESCSEQDGALKFWFNSVHLLCNDADHDDLLQRNPPVLLVGTHTDLFEGDETKCNEKLKEQLYDIQPELRQHIRGKALISNTKDAEKTFDKLRESIIGIAQQGTFWNMAVPVKFILLEEKIDRYKHSNTFFLSFDQILNIAKETDQPITEVEHIDLFLRVHHEIGNIVYFRDIPECVILNPQWLVDIFKSIVTADPFQLNCFGVDWNEVNSTGRLQKQLLDTIISEHVEDGPPNDYVLKVLEKCDIIVRPRTLGYHHNSEKLGDYYVPCMVKTAVPCDIVRICQMYLTYKSTILCLVCSFLPPVIFNHLLIACCHKPEWSVATIEIENKKRLAFFKNCAVFDILANGCKKLFLTRFGNVIQLQIWNFGKMVTPSGDIRSFIVDEFERIAFKRIHVNRITFKEKMKCPDSRFDTLDEMIDYDRMKTEPITNEYFCSVHKKPHDFIEEWYGSTRVLNSEQLNFARMGIITLDILADVLFDLLRQDSASIVDRSKHDITSLYKKHMQNNKYIPSTTAWGRKNGEKVDDVNPNYTEIGDDIERVRLIRNEVQHCKTFTLTKKRSDELYLYVTTLLKRFDQRIKTSGKSYHTRAEEVKAMTVTSYEMETLQNTLQDGDGFDKKEIIIFGIGVLCIALLLQWYHRRQLVT